MKQIIEKHFCDICKKEIERPITIDYPVVFYTEQTEGRSCKPYIDEQKLELCEDCANEALRITATGAQGYNDYKLKGENHDCP